MGQGAKDRMSQGIQRVTPLPHQHWGLKSLAWLPPLRLPEAAAFLFSLAGGGDRGCSSACRLDAALSHPEHLLPRQLGTSPWHPKSRQEPWGRSLLRKR